MYTCGEMQYLEEEKGCREAAGKFAAAFDGVNNAVIMKSQVNGFGLKVKYPLLITLCLLAVAAVFVLMFSLRLFDVMFIVCVVIITAVMLFFATLLVRTWLITIKNSKLAEKITYYRGKNVWLVAEITGGGRKIEWDGISFYIKGDDFELVESPTKQYNPYFYKKLHGHSRGHKLLKSETIVKAFFDGATVLSDDGNIVCMSSGFKFCVEHGTLKYFEIEGFYDECYENNFPLLSIKPQSRSYVFRYDFTAVNVPNFRLILPDRSVECAKLFFTEIPRDDKNIFINS